MLSFVLFQLGRMGIVLLLPALALSAVARSRSARDRPARAYARPTR